jgi:DNA-binding transcriptional regulator YhcF (GntR family)
MPTVKASGAGDRAAARPGGEPGFVKARRVRSFDDVVEQVRAAIIDGSILAGERLPSERELAEQFGVSRATLREALRALEALGLIEIRVGANGGAFATDGALERSVESLRHVVDIEAAARPHHTRRFRASVHADNAAWVGGSADDLGAIEQAIPQGARAFLIAVAECSRTPLRVALATALESADTGHAYPSLTTAQMKRVVDLLRRGRRMDCRELVFGLLGGTQPTETAR